MKKKLTILLILFLIISEIITLSLIFKKEDNTILKDIEITNNFNNKKQMISIKVENDDDYEYHDYEDKTKWPDKTKYTYAGSVCTDWGGNNINESIIKFDEVNYKATITTKRTAYCTLYFTKGKLTKEHLESKSGSQLQSDAVFGLYRYKGLDSSESTDSNQVFIKNNYICFGTTDIATCTGSDKQYYMYRIIGITDGTETNTNLGLKEGQLKIIRNYPLESQMQWNNSSGSDYNWDVSTLQTYLNGSFLTLNKSKWLDGDYWENKIVNVRWYIGNVSNISTTEPTNLTSDLHKIGLMYLSDFYNSGTGYYHGWLYVGHALSSGGYPGEWTISSKAYGGWKKEAWHTAYGEEYWFYDYVDEEQYVRPVFYINALTLAGEGTETSPFIITSKN